MTYRVFHRNGPNVEVTESQDLPCWVTLLDRPWLAVGDIVIPEDALMDITDERGNWLPLSNPPEEK